MEKIGVDHGICIITIVLNHNINHVIILVGFVEFFYSTRRLCILLELVSLSFVYNTIYNETFSNHYSYEWYTFVRREVS